MKKFLFIISLVIITLFVWFIGCENDYPASLYDPNAQSLPQPVITGINPPNVGYAAVENITITGRNFSAVKEENFVYFGKSLVPILEATTTQLKLKAPNVTGDSIIIKIGVKGSELFSDPVVYKLSPAFIEFGGYGKFDDVYSLEFDANGNLYLSYSLGTTSKIEKVGTDGQKSDFATCTFPFARSMKFGPDGYLYMARLIPLIYRIPKTGGAASVYVTLPNAGKAYDMDFDKDGNLWVGGYNNYLYCVKPDKSVKTFDFVASVNAVRVYNDYLYVAGKDETENEYIWKFKINSGDNLGPKEVVLNWTNIMKGPGALTMTFANDGDLYVGTTGPDSVAIAVVHPNLTVEPLYKGYLQVLSYYITWGSGSMGKYLFVSRRNDNVDLKRVMQIYMAKEGAPYFGRK